MPAPRTRPTADPGAVLTKAFRRAAEALGMTQREMAAVLGASEASISRLGRTRTIDHRSKEGELALLTVRVYRSLHALLGGDVDAVRAWFRAENRHLGAVPATLVRSVQGLIATVQYLDAMRGRG